MAGLGDITPPASYSMGQTGPSYAQSFPLTGLASLLQGITHGVELGNEMSMRNKQLENEAAYRNAMLGNRQDMLGIRQEMADIAKERADKGFAPAGQPVPVPDGQGGTMMALTDGKGGIKFPPASKGPTARDQETASALEALNEAEAQRDKLGYSDTAAGGVISGLFKSALSHVQGTDAEQYRSSSLPAAIAAVKKLAGRTNEVEIEKMGEALAGMGGTRESNHEKFERMQRILTAGQGGGSKPSSPAGQIHTYPSGRQIQWNGSTWVPYTP